MNLNAVDAIATYNTEDKTLTVTVSAEESNYTMTVVFAVCAVELLQLWTRRGSLDVDDLILNVPGACLGWTAWRLWPKKKNHGNAS